VPGTLKAPGTFLFLSIIAVNKWGKPIAFLMKGFAILKEFTIQFSCFEPVYLIKHPAWDCYNKHNLRMKLGSETRIGNRLAITVVTFKIKRRQN